MSIRRVAICLIFFFVSRRFVLLGMYVRTYLYHNLETNCWCHKVGKKSQSTFISFLSRRRVCRLKCAHSTTKFETWSGLGLLWIGKCVLKFRPRVERSLASTTKPFLTIESYSHKMIVLQAIPELPCRRQSSLLLLLKETILFWGKVPIDTSNYMPIIIIIICTRGSRITYRYFIWWFQKFSFLELIVRRIIEVLFWAKHCICARERAYNNR